MASNRNTSSGGRRIAMPQRNPRSDAAAAKAAARNNRNLSQRTSSVRIGDLPREGRTPRTAAAAATQARATAWARRLAVALVAVVLVVAAGVALYLSPVLPVKQVTVTGVEHLTSAQVAEAAAVPTGSTLLRVDTAGIEERLRQNPWVESAQVARVFPDTLELRITERRIAAVVTITSTEGQQTENWAIAQDGMWLVNIPAQGTPAAAEISPQIYVDAENVLLINDVPYGIVPEVGTYCTDSSVTNALNIVSQLSTDLSSHVVQVSATDTSNTTLTLDSGVQIAFGPADDVRDKERVVLQLLAEHPDTIAYINVRVVDRPTWRALSGDAGTVGSGDDADEGGEGGEGSGQGQDDYDDENYFSGTYEDGIDLGDVSDR